MQSSSPFLYDTLLLVNKISKHKLSPIHSRSLEALSTRGVAMSCGNVGGGGGTSSFPHWPLPLPLGKVPIYYKVETSTIPRAANEG